METPLKIKRNYTKRTADQRRDLLQTRIVALKLAHLTRQKLIERLELKLHTPA